MGVRWLYVMSEELGPTSAIQREVVHPKALCKPRFFSSSVILAVAKIKVNPFA